MSQSSVTSYEKQLNGSFSSLLRWPDFDAFWQQLRLSDGKDWYIHSPDQPPPSSPVTPDEFKQRLQSLENWLKSNHQEDYCGIVYVDNKENPSFIKIYDPNNLGVVCGISRTPIAPAWTLSKSKPAGHPLQLGQEKRKQHWWRKLISTKS